MSILERSLERDFLLEWATKLAVTARLPAQKPSASRLNVEGLCRRLIRRIRRDCQKGSSYCCVGEQLASKAFVPKLPLQGWTASIPFRLQSWSRNFYPLYKDFARRSPRQGRLPKVLPRAHLFLPSFPKFGIFIDHFWPGKMFCFLLGKNANTKL